MRKVGAILAMIAGVLSIAQASAELLLGGMFAQFHWSAGRVLLDIGWGAEAVAIVTIVCGALCFARAERWPAIAIIGGAVIAIAGSPFTALPMAFALIGGVLVLLAKPPGAAVAAPPPVTDIAEPPDI